MDANRLVARYGEHGPGASTERNGKLTVITVMPNLAWRTQFLDNCWLLYRPIKLVSIAHVQSYQSAAKGQQGWVIAPTLAGDKLILHIHTPITDTTGLVVGVFGSPVPLPTGCHPARALHWRR